jgi:hypothetical protein
MPHMRSSRCMPNGWFVLLHPIRKRCLQLVVDGRDIVTSTLNIVVTRLACRTWSTTVVGTPNRALLGNTEVGARVAVSGVDLGTVLDGNVVDSRDGVTSTDVARLLLTARTWAITVLSAPFRALLGFAKVSARVAIVVTLDQLLVVDGRDIVTGADVARLLLTGRTWSTTVLSAPFTAGLSLAKVSARVAIALDQLLVVDGRDIVTSADNTRLGLTGRAWSTTVLGTPNRALLGHAQIATRVTINLTGRQGLRGEFRLQSVVSSESRGKTEQHNNHQQDGRRTHIN